MSRKGENIYKRKDGRWEGRYACGIKANGRSKYISVYGSSYKEVKEKLRMRKSESSHGSKKLRFCDAAEKWLEYIRLRVKISTFSNYTYLVKKHIVNYFAGRYINELDPREINAFIKFKLSDGKLKSTGGISKKYMRDILYVVKSIAAFCEQEYGIENLIKNITSPKPEKKEMPILKEAETKRLSRRLMKNTSDTDILILLSLYTGLRIGEACGLRWGDYDSAKRLISVRRTVQRVSNNDGTTSRIEGAPKTQSSARTIPIPDFICRILNNIKSEKKPEEPIALTEPRLLRRKFLKLLKECNIRRIRYHDLRHNFASWGLRLHFDVKALSEILGHSSAAVTLDRYAHTSMEVKRKYMELLSC